MSMERGFASLGWFTNIIGAMHCTHCCHMAIIITKVHMWVWKPFAHLWYPDGTAEHGQDPFILQNCCAGTAGSFVSAGCSVIFSKSSLKSPQKTWLFMPLSPDRAKMSHTMRYNTITHNCERSVVERAIGINKGRWLCLKAAVGRLLYKPGKCLPNYISLLHAPQCGLESWDCTAAGEHETQWASRGSLPHCGPPDKAAAVPMRRQLIHWLWLGGYTVKWPVLT